MPTLLNEKGFRFFYSNENNEPYLVHVTKAGAEGKVWLEPQLSVCYLFRFTANEEKDILAIINIHLESFKRKWHEYFRK
jgi:Domain of unknown function (DUF4160)